MVTEEGTLKEPFDGQGNKKKLAADQERIVAEAKGPVPRGDESFEKIPTSKYFWSVGGYLPALTDQFEKGAALLTTKPVIP